MLIEFFRSLNWVDVLMTGIIVRAIYVGMKSGFVVELFKLAGVFFAIFVTHHYYQAFGVILNKFLRLPVKTADLVSFVLLWIAVFLIFKLIRDGILIVLKMNAHPGFDLWGGFAVAIVRGVLLCSLTFVFLSVSGIDYLAENSEHSLSGSYCRDLSLRIYKGSYEKLVSGFFEGEKLNDKVFDPRKDDQHPK